MFGLYLLAFFVVCVLFSAAWHESNNVVADSPPAPPTKDAYDE